MVGADLGGPEAALDVDKRIFALWAHSSAAL